MLDQEREMQSEDIQARSNKSMKNLRFKVLKKFQRSRMNVQIKQDEFYRFYSFLKSCN